MYDCSSYACICPPTPMPMPCCMTHAMTSCSYAWSSDMLICLSICAPICLPMTPAYAYPYDAASLHDGASYISLIIAHHASHHWLIIEWFINHLMIIHHWLIMHPHWSLHDDRSSDMQWSISSPLLLFSSSFLIDHASSSSFSFPEWYSS